MDARDRVVFRIDGNGDVFVLGRSGHLTRINP
jgi:hypothetical protein